MCPAAVRAWMYGVTVPFCRSIWSPVVRLSVSEVPTALPMLGVMNVGELASAVAPVPVTPFDRSATESPLLRTVYQVPPTENVGCEKAFVSAGGPIAMEPSGWVQQG